MIRGNCNGNWDFIFPHLDNVLSSNNLALLMLIVPLFWLCSSSSAQSLHTPGWTTNIRRRRLTKAGSPVAKNHYRIRQFPFRTQSPVSGEYKILPLRTSSLFNYEIFIIFPCSHGLNRTNSFSCLFWGESSIYLLSRWSIYVKHRCQNWLWYWASYYKIVIRAILFSPTSRQQRVRHPSSISA